MTTINGLLLVDKPSGVTSHDVVAKVRQIFGEKRVGHAGTLDPMATGLLILAVGPATRLLRFAQGEAKRYAGTVTFGVRTDSLDADGEVLERRDVALLDPSVLSDVASSMCGEQLQIPPMVSAIQVKGRRLHDMARAGLEVEREPRTISIDAFRVAPTANPNEWTFEVACSVGTYVRVLLSDFAERVGTVGHLSALRRTASGTHRVEDAVTLDELERLVASGQDPLEPPRALVTMLETVDVSEDEAARIRMGQRVTLAGAIDDEVAAIDESGALVGVLFRRGEVFQPDVIMVLERPMKRQ
jgi:tRNA pseudouridine55 synthase